MKRAVAIIVLLWASAAFANETADRVIVMKNLHQMQLLHDGHVIRTYKVALGPAIAGHKQRQGDGKTPEGLYVIDARNPQSQFYKSLHISYPNPNDLKIARRSGVDPGGDIMIHGLGKKYGWVGGAHRLRDWTAGCIAVTNEEIDEIWKLVPNGTVVEIRP